MDIMIRKRDGHFEPLSVEKTKRMIAFACLGLDSCDPMELEMDSKLQFVDGMTTKQIQQTLIRTAIEKVIPSRHEGGGVPLQVNSKRAQLKKHQMELVGDELRRNMIWGGDKDLDTASN